MKEYLLGLIGLAALGSVALAQAPMALPSGPGGAAPAAAVPVVEHGACCGQAGSCTPTKTICAPEQYMKKKIKVVYSCGCEPFCVDYRWGLFKKCSCCGDNAPNPSTKKFLIKKLQKSECPAVKCVPVCVPACEPAGCCTTAGCCK